MNDSSHLVNIIVRLRADAQGIAKQLSGLQKEQQKLNKEFERGNVQASDYARTTNKLKKTAHDLRREQGKLASEIKKGRTEVRRFLGSAKGMEEFNKKFARGMEDVTKEGTRFNRNLGRVSRTIKEVGRESRKTDSDIRGLGRGISFLRRQTREVDSDFNRMRKAWSQSSNEVKGLERRLALLGRAMLGLAIASMIIFTQAFASALVSLGGSAISAASSLSIAAGTLVGSFIPAVAQAIPVVGLLIGALSRLSGIQEAIAQKDSLAATAADSDATAKERQKEAANAIEDAERNLADAKRGSSDAQRETQQAQEDLTEARKEARAEIDALRLAEQQAALAAQRSALDQKQAKDDLATAIREGDVSGIAGAQLGVKEAALNRRQANKDLSDARKESARAQREGVEGSDAVQAAQERVRTSARGVADAQRALAEAHREAGVAAADQTSTEVRLDSALQKLTGAERRLMDAFLRFRDRMRKVFLPVTDIIIDSFTRALGRVENLLFDPKIVSGVTKLAEGVAGGIDKLTKSATDSRSRRFWEFTLAEGRKNLKPITDIMVDLIQVFEKFARAAAPAFRRILFLIRKEVDALSKTDFKDLRDFFDDGVKHLRAWWNLLKAVVNLFAALAGASSQSGLKAVRDLADTLNDAAESLRENREGAEDFFEAAKRGTDTLGRVLVALGEELVKSFDPEALAAFADLLIKVLIPALGFHIRAMGEVAKVMKSILEIPFAADVLKWSVAIFTVFGSVGLLVRIISVALSPLVRFIAVLKEFGPIIKLMDRLKGVLFGVRVDILRLGVLRGVLLPLTRVLGVVGAAIMIVVGAVQAIKENFLGAADSVRRLGNFFEDIWKDMKALGREFGALLDEMSGGNGDKILRALGNAAKFLAKHLGEVLEFAGKLAGRAALQMLIDTVKTLAIPFKAAIDGIRGVIRALRGFIDIVKGVVDIVAGVFTGDWDRAWSGLKRVARGAIDVVLGLFQALTAPIRSTVDTIADILTDKFANAWKVVKNAALDAIDAILGGISSLLDGISKIPDTPFTPDVGGAAGSARDEIDKLRESLRGTEKQQKKTTKEIEDGAKATEHNTRLVREQRKERDKTTESTKKHGKEVKDTTDKLGKEEKGIRNTIQGTRKLGHTNIGAAKTSQKLGGTIAEITNKVLKQFSAKELRFGISKEGQGIRTPTELAQGGYQSGGYIERRGLRGLDTYTARVAPGEAIITGHDEPIVDASMKFAKQYGIQPYNSLDDMFRGVRKPHATAPRAIRPPASPSFQMGGRFGARLPAFAKGGRSSYPDAMGALPGLDALGWFLNKKFGLQVVSGARPGAVTTTGNTSDHSWGGAIDVSNGVTTPQMNQAYKFLLKSLGGGIGPGESVSGGLIKQMLYKTMIGGNHFDHIHVALVEGAAHNAARVIAALGGKGMAGGFGGLPKIKIKGPKGPLKDQLQAQADTMTKEADKYLAKKTGGPAAIGKYHPGEYGGTLTPKQFLSIAMQALKITGKFPATRGNAKKLLSLAQGESGLQVKIVNNWDSNAAAGNPSQGLMQVIPTTFKAYHQKGTDGILDPLANIAASINYQKATYGRLLSSGPYGTGGRFGFAGEFGGGGIVPGPIGHPQIAVVHGGETVLPTFQGGGRTPSISDIAPPGRKKSLKGADDALKDILDELAEAFDNLKKGKKDFEKFSKLIESILGEGKLMDQITEELDALSTDLANKLLSDTFDVVKEISKKGGKKKRRKRRRRNTGTVVQELDELEIAIEELENLEEVYRFLEEQRRALKKTMRNLRKQMKKLNRKIKKEDDKKVKEELKADKETLETAINNTKDRLQDLGGLIGENLQARWEAQLAVIEARVGQFEIGRGLLDASLSAIEAFSQLMGKPLTQATVDVLNQQAASLRKQIKFLEGELAAARDRGDVVLTQQLEQMLRDTQVALLETQVSIMEAWREHANNIIEKFEFTLNVQSARQAIIQSLNQLNDTFNLSGMVANLNQQLSTLRLEEASIRQQIDKARARGDTELVRELTITLLSVQQAIVDTQIAIMQSYRDAVQRQLDLFAHRIGVVDARAGIVQALDQLNDTISTSQIVSLIKQRISLLQQQANYVRSQIQAALSRGDTEFARELELTLLGIQQSIVDAQVQIMEAYRNEVQDKISRFEFTTSLLNAQIGILDALGQFQDVLFTETIVDLIRDRIDNLQAQMDAVSDALSAAQSRGDDVLVRELQQALLDIQNQIIDSQIAIFQAYRDAANKAIQEFTRQIGLEDIRTRILQLQGEISGVIDQAGLIALAEARKTLLLGQRAEIETQLAGAQDRGDVVLIKELEEALLNNELALLENTKELLELNGQLGQPQGFTSTAWELFRIAVFNGMGGLMPQLQPFIPSMQTGGPVTQTGLHFLHQGEYVIPPPGTTSSQQVGGQTVNVGGISITEPMEVADPNTLANKIAFRLKSAKAL
jgi:DNA repair exonuclease SbcCD ATPase subunit